jgi:hypothetical protein
MSTTKAPPKRPGRPILSTYVDAQTMADVRAAADKRGVSVSALLRKALDSVLVGTTGDGLTAVALNDNAATTAAEKEGVP